MNMRHIVHTIFMMGSQRRQDQSDEPRQTDKPYFMFRRIWMNHIAALKQRLEVTRLKAVDDSY